MLNALSIDVEEYFQVEALSGKISRASWSDIDSRIERSVDRLLQIFADSSATGTFFTLGWIATRHRQMVRRIVDNGHELASHGFEHWRVDHMSQEQFRSDAERTKKLLEDLSGETVRGYRAASFSVNEDTPWFFDTLEALGHAYSSSVYPIRHDLYGLPTAPRFVHRAGLNQTLLEIPISTTTVFGSKVPCGGGGYFRLFPYPLSRWALRRVNRQDRQPCVFYLHPWEVDPDQPRIPHLPIKSRIRHYLNLSRTENRLTALLSDFSWSRMDQVFLREWTGIA